MDLALKTSFTYWPNKTASDGTNVGFQDALRAAGNPEEDARRQTACEVLISDPTAGRSSTRFGGHPTLVSVLAY